MSITVDAVYENGALKLAAPLPLKEHEEVRVTVHSGKNWEEHAAGTMGFTGSAEKAEYFARSPDLDEALEETLGDQLLREAQDGQAELAAGWREFMAELGISGEPIGAKVLRDRLMADGIDPNENVASRGLIGMREE